MLHPQGVSSSEALDCLAALGRLFIQFGGDVSELSDPGKVWFIAKIGPGAAPGADQRIDTVEPSDDFVRHLAALAGKLEKLLIKHAENHPEPLTLAFEAQTLRAHAAEGA